MNEAGLRHVYRTHLAVTGEVDKATLRMRSGNPPPMKGVLLTRKNGELYWLAAIPLLGSLARCRRLPEVVQGPADASSVGSCRSRLQPR